MLWPETISYFSQKKKKKTTTKKQQTHAHAHTHTHIHKCFTATHYIRKKNVKESDSEPVGKRIMTLKCYKEIIVTSLGDCGSFKL